MRDSQPGERPWPGGQKHRRLAIPATEEELAKEAGIRAVQVRAAEAGKLGDLLVYMKIDEALRRLEASKASRE